MSVVVFIRVFVKLGMPNICSNLFFDRGVFEKEFFFMGGGGILFWEFCLKRAKC